MSDDALPQRPPLTRHDIGESLDRMSAEELSERVDLLRAEIERLEAAIQAKRASKTAADSFFRR